MWPKRKDRTTVRLPLPSVKVTAHMCRGEMQGIINHYSCLGLFTRGKAPRDLKQHKGASGKWQKPRE